MIPLARFRTYLSPLLRVRTTRRRAIAATAVSTATSLAMLGAAAAWSSSTDPLPHWMPSAIDASPTPGTPGTPPAPPHQRSMAVGAEHSPTPSSNARSGDFTAWAIMNLRTGEIVGSPNLGRTSTTASLIKAWLVADYLRRVEEPPPDRMHDLRVIIRDSNNPRTQVLFQELGQEESIHRLIDICGLTDSRAVPGTWSNTRLSPRDTARMGACIANGHAAGDWTGWLLEQMQLVRGVGDFGIRDAFPPAVRQSIAIKNGWVIRSAVDEYHVNCLAIGDGWSMGVMIRYPAEQGYQHGAELCRSLAAEELLPRVTS